MQYANIEEVYWNRVLTDWNQSVAALEDQGEGVFPATQCYYRGFLQFFPHLNATYK
jgi:hypothetical protein